MNVSAARPSTTPPPVQRTPAPTRDADGDNDGSSARTSAPAAKPSAATAPAVQNGKVDLYA